MLVDLKDLDYKKFPQFDPKNQKGDRVSPNVGRKIARVAMKEEDKESMEFLTGQMAFWAKQYRFHEADFGKKLERDKRLSYELLEESEKLASSDFESMKSFEKRTGLSIYERDKIENIGYIDPAETIEAAAGEFFMRRRRALEKKVLESSNPEKEKDVKIGDELYRLYGEHLYYCYDYETKRTDYEAYQANRRNSHNNLINYLNLMNDTARKYDVTPFTFRNFLPNDFIYDEDLDIGKYTDRRAEYDRATVEFYCRNAFPSIWEKADREYRRGNMYH